MAGQIPLSGGNPTARPNTIGSGGGSISMAQQRSGETSIGVGSSGPGVGMSQQNLNGIVSVYGSFAAWKYSSSLGQHFSIRAFCCGEKYAGSNCMSSPYGSHCPQCVICPAGSHTDTKMKLPDHVGLKTKSHSERAKRAQNLGSTTCAQR